MAHQHIWEMADRLEATLREALAGEEGWRERAGKIMDVLDDKAVELRVSILVCWHSGPEAIKDTKLRQAIWSFAAVFGFEPEITTISNRFEIHGFVYPDGRPVFTAKENSA